MSEYRVGIPAFPFRKPQEGDLQAQTHYHTRRSDGFGEPVQVLENAITSGIHVLIPTDHDKTGGAAEMLNCAEKRNYINKTNGKDHFEVIYGQEVTSKEDEHLLVWGAVTTILCGLPTREIAEIAHSQDALVVVPHPGFLQGQGIPWEDVDMLIELGLVDAIELRNGAQETLTYMSRILASLPLVGEHIAKRIAPNGDSNLEALKHYRRTGGRGYAITAGQDGHLASSPSLTKVVTLYPEGMTFFDAVRQSRTVFSTKNEPEFWGPRMFWSQNALSMKLEDDRKNNRNGIMCVPVYERQK